MRSQAKAEQLRQDRARELVLQHPHGADVLEASNGDAEHALRILDELKTRHAGGEVIRLPSTPILDFNDVLDEDSETVELDRRGWDVPVALVVLGLGLAGWLIIAAVAYGILRLVEALS